MKVIGVIPARYASSRFPGKPLADICGKPMIWWVWQRAMKCDQLDDLVVAIDDERIERACIQYNIPYVMTSNDHATPTDRIIEVSEHKKADLFITIMGDEPLLSPISIESMIPNSIDGLYVANLIKPLTSASEVIDTTNQKVVTNGLGNIMLTSRSPIPFPKGSLDIEYFATGSTIAATRDALSFYEKAKRSSIEIAEENDILRWLYAGVPVKAVLSKDKSISVDTPKDLDKVRNIIQSTSQL